MTPERWKQVKDVFDSVRDLAAEEQNAAIDARCADDTALRKEVRSLLAHMARATGFLEPVPAGGLSSIMPLLNEPEAQRPTRLGQYAVEHELGRGGMGVVYLARDPGLDRLVALKVLPEVVARDRDRILRFEREARILASLNHPNVAAIYSLDQDPTGARFLVLEFVPGRTLAQRAEEGPMPVDEALHVCAQVCRGLEAAHGRGVVHRDLKPENIRITPTGLVKVLDFGLARRDGHRRAGSSSSGAPESVATQPGLVLGTPGYMSPEQARGRPVDERTDIFAFGCILFLCLTGKPAFGRETMSDSLAAVLKEQADLSRLPPGVPPRARELLSRCLEKEPESRVRHIGLVRRELEAAILDLGGGAAAGSIMPAASVWATAMRLHAPPTHNLPRQLTSFVGRDREVGEVSAMLDQAPLLTLTGAGGCGKTRLAIRVASDVMDRFPGGVWLVELAAITDPALVAFAAASAVGVREEPSRPLLRTLIERLEARRVLLIFDNCEHLLASVGQLAQELLRACPDLKLMATSREALGIPGEVAWRVPSLSMPDLPTSETVTAQTIGQAESVRLFVERARAARPGFELSDAAAPHVARICRRLDGIPLAIELAAARVKVLSVDQISAKLGDRFRLLVGGSRTALERHQTLRAAIDWSYGLLTEDERRVLRAMSVFAGGSTLDAAAAVCGGDEFQVLDQLTHLVDKSLLIAEESAVDAGGGEGGHPVRYRLLETVRQYAREKLQGPDSPRQTEASEVSERHVQFFRGLAERAEPELLGKDQRAWLERLDAEHENLLAAVEWCAGAAQHAPEGDRAWSERGLRLVGALGRFWSTRGHSAAGRSAVATVLAHDAGASPTEHRAKALNAAGGLAWAQGDTAAAGGYWQETLAIQRGLGNRRAVAGALNNLGAIAQSRADYAGAKALYEEALALNRALGNRPWEAININNLGNIASNQRDYSAARVLYEQALAINRDLGNRSGESQNLNNLGSAARDTGDCDAARGFYREALRLKRDLGDKRGIATTLGQLGTVAAIQRDLAAAGKLISDALLIRRELGDKEGIAMSLEETAVVGCATGVPEFAARSFAAADRLRHEIGAPLAAAERTRSELGMEAARTALGDAAFRAAWDRGGQEGWSRLADEALAWLRTVRATGA